MFFSKIYSIFSFADKLKITTQLSQALQTWWKVFLPSKRWKAHLQRQPLSHKTGIVRRHRTKLAGHPAHLRIKVEDKNSKSSSKWVCAKSAFSPKLLSCFCHADIWQFVVTVVEKAQSVQFVRQTSEKKCNPTSCNQHVVGVFLLL